MTALMMYHFYFWLFGALACVGIELTTPGLFFFVAFAGGCVIASGAALLGYSLMAQCIIALINSIIVFVIIKRWVAPSSKEGREHIKTNYQGVIGKRGVVLDSIEPGSYGYVKIGGERWRARSYDVQLCNKGDHVIVVGVHGNHVRIKPVKE